MHELLEGELARLLKRVGVDRELLARLTVCYRFSGADQQVYSLLYIADGPLQTSLSLYLGVRCL